MEQKKREEKVKEKGHIRKQERKETRQIEKEKEKTARIFRDLGNPQLIHYCLVGQKKFEIPQNTKCNYIMKIM